MRSKDSRKRTEALSLCADSIPHYARSEPSSGRAAHVRARSRLDVASKYDCASPEPSRERRGALVRSAPLPVFEEWPLQTGVSGKNDHPPVRFVHSAGYPDDGPPRSRRRESRDDQNDDRKTRQLCAQIRRALHGVIPLPGASLFEGLIVEAVEPDPDASRVRVVISVPLTTPASVTALKQRLDQMAGFIRSEVAPRITGKRVPTLSFELIPREEDV